MSTNKLFDFTFPFKQDIPLKYKGTKVCIVSVIGKSNQNNHKSKASILNNVVDSDVFPDKCLPDSDQHMKNLINIEGHYNESSNVIYLHLRSAYDTNTMAELCHKANEEIAVIGYQNFFQSTEYQHVRALLYLFSVSHIILLVHPGSSFDVSYVRLFRILDIVRLKLRSCVSDSLRGLGISKDWLLAGRPCSPRVLFIFERCAIGPSENMDTAVTNKVRSQKIPPIKRLQHSIEDQIYRILRKSRIITNISNNSLFAVPANQEFVFICAQQELLPDPVSNHLAELHASCAVKESDMSHSRSYQTNRRANNRPGSSGSTHTFDSSTAQSTSPRSRDTRTFFIGLSEPNGFKDFLWQHVELCLGNSKGFDDNVGRNPVPPVFEVPHLQLWFDVGNKLFDLFMTDQVESKPHFNTLKSLLEIDVRFSELRCTKVLPMAEAAYREGLPHHYTRSYHQSKVEQAVQVFQQHARGSACDKYIQQLTEDCDQFWRNGREQCEEISLTGQPCVNQLHRLPEMPETESNASLSSMSHSSQVKTKAACNCGNKQGEREDPFDHRTANYDFYQKLAVHCCASLNHFSIPVFQASTSDIRAHSSVDAAGDSVLATAKTVKKVEPSTKDTKKDYGTKFETASGLSGLSLALSLGESGGSDVYGHTTSGDVVMYDQSTHDSFNDEQTNDQDVQVSVETDDNDAPLSPFRQVSTTEYIPGMLHTDSPVGLLPKFPSWSLLCSGSYNPGQGLDQPAFMHGSNFLLPWDRVIKVSEKWPTVGETPSTKKGKPSRKPIKEAGEISFRLYVGLEYECTRGHRFTMCGPDKIFKAPPTGNFKETANKIINNEMPLYYPCTCRSPKGYMGQLIRIFIDVPEGPIDVKLNVRVRPHPMPCPIFYPTTEGSISLASGLWVLRLPYVYLGETGPYIIPSDPAALSACVLSKGFLVVQDAGL